MITRCQDCFYLPQCGGTDGHPDLFGCHLHSREDCGRHQWTCFECRPAKFLRRLSEVGGFQPPPPRTVRPPRFRFPAFLPRIEHASSIEGQLSVRVVAIPTRSVVAGRGRSFSVKLTSASELRTAFHLAPRTDVFLVTVAPDQYLERFWKYHRANEIGPRLARLGVIGISVPNFSFFSDAPRPHTLNNRGRLSRTIERLSESGVAVVPHLNALTVEDWNHWLIMLQMHPRLRHVAKEFQTHDGTSDLENLARLQDKLGRSLHPILIGAGKYAARAGKLFESCTLVSSTPWFKAVKARQRLCREGSRVRWRDAKVGNGAPLCALLDHNLREYTAHMTDCVHGRIPAQLTMLDAMERALKLQPAGKDDRQPMLWVPERDGAQRERTR